MSLHVHFDCFSGAAGDMLLASLIDSQSTEKKKFLVKLNHHLKAGLQEIAHEFDVKIDRVWRGSGSIAGTKVTVDSIYQHASAPVPKFSEHSHEHEHSHIHNHEHKHEHNHEQKGNEGHSHSHEHHSHDGQEHKHSKYDSVTGHSHSHLHSTLSSGPLRNFVQIKSLIDSADDDYIPPRAKRRSIAAFKELAKAEADTHGSTFEDVHFHEVGAVDSIIDVLGVCLALELLGIGSISCSGLPMGEGTVWTDHGLLPVPAPATLRLLQDMYVVPGPPGLTGELVTPTAAALLKTLTKDPTTKDEKHPPGRPPSFFVKAVGVGAGTKNFEKHPNITRAIIGKIYDKCNKISTPPAPISVTLASSSNIEIHNLSTTVEDESHEKNSVSMHTLACLEANIDDCTPEVMAYAVERLLDAGAVDAWLTPIIMKKGRPAQTLHCLYHQNLMSEYNVKLQTKLIEVILSETTTLGVRIVKNIERIAIERSIVEVETPYSTKTPVNVKIGKYNGDIIQCKAEFDDCKKLARESGTPLQKIAEKAKYLSLEMLKPRLTTTSSSSENTAQESEDK